MAFNEVEMDGPEIEKKAESDRFMQLVQNHLTKGKTSGKRFAWSRSILILAHWQLLTFRTLKKTKDQATRTSVRSWPKEWTPAFYG